jgi:hypothetical protein
MLKILISIHSFPPNCFLPFLKSLTCSLPSGNRMVNTHGHNCHENGTRMFDYISWLAIVD